MRIQHADRDKYVSEIHDLVHRYPDETKASQLYIKINEILQYALHETDDVFCLVLVKLAREVNVAVRNPAKATTYLPEEA